MLLGNKYIHSALCAYTHIQCSGYFLKELAEKKRKKSEIAKENLHWPLLSWVFYRRGCKRRNSFTFLAKSIIFMLQELTLVLFAHTANEREIERMSYRVLTVDGKLVWKTKPAHKVKIASINSFDGFFCCWTRHYYHLSYSVVGKWDTISTERKWWWRRQRQINRANERKKYTISRKRVRQKVFSLFFFDLRQSKRDYEYFGGFFCLYVQVELGEMFWSKKFNRAKPNQCWLRTTLSLCTTTRVSFHQRTVRTWSEKKRTNNTMKTFTNGMWQWKSEKNIIGLMNVRQCDEVLENGWQEMKTQT